MDSHHFIILHLTGYRLPQKSNLVKYEVQGQYITLGLGNRKKQVGISLERAR
jgi:hypothetical protein